MPDVLTVSDAAYNKHLQGFLGLFNLSMVFRLPVSCIRLCYFRHHSPGDFGTEGSREAGAEAGKRLP